jgi:hypothetical protein
LRQREESQEKKKKNFIKHHECALYILRCGLSGSKHALYLFLDTTGWKKGKWGKLRPKKLSRANPTDAREGNENSVQELGCFSNENFLFPFRICHFICLSRHSVNEKFEQNKNTLNETWQHQLAWKVINLLSWNYKKKPRETNEFTEKSFPFTEPLWKWLYIFFHS